MVPSSLLPYAAAVHHSATARLLPNVTPRWDRELRAYLDNFTARHLSPALQRELRLLSSGSNAAARP